MENYVSPFANSSPPSSPSASPPTSPLSPPSSPPSFLLNSITSEPNEESLAGGEGGRALYEDLLIELAVSFGSENIKPSDILTKYTKTSKLLAAFFAGMKEVPSVFEGFVSKKGEDNTRWKMRYFVLKHGFFYYAKSKDDKPLGLVFLPKQLTVVEDSRQSNFKIFVKWPGRTYFLSCDNKMEWIGHLKAAVTDVPLGKAARETHSYRGLSKLLASESGVLSFKKFLESEFSAENLLLWEDINRYQKFETQEELLTGFNAIYSQYFARAAPQLVNLPHTSRMLIEKAKQDSLVTGVSPTTFDVVQRDVLALMKLDSFARYKSSPFFSNFLEERKRVQKGN